MAKIIEKLIKKFLIKPLTFLYSRKKRKYNEDQSFSISADKFRSRNDLHAYMHHYFHHLCPLGIRVHREYFKNNNRGFGEDAFHAMWYLLLREFRPRRCLEIGVYRGQVISLWALIAKELDYTNEITGISPFTPAGDGVSVYLKNIDYKQDVLDNHINFDLPKPTLLRALSTDNDAVEYIRKNSWDLIYIDGGHDYEVALSDYKNCRDSLADNGLLVMDDSSLYTDYNPPLFSFAGHPGPSRVVKELAMKELKFIGAVGHNNIFMKKVN